MSGYTVVDSHRMVWRNLRLHPALKSGTWAPAMGGRCSRCVSRLEPPFPSDSLNCGKPLSGRRAAVSFYGFP